MGQQLASRISTDFRTHLESSKTWARIEEGRPLTPTETGDFIVTLSSGLLAGLRTIALAIVEPEAEASEH